MRTARGISALLVTLVLAGGCQSGDDDTTYGGPDASNALQDPGKCVAIDVAVSSEKIALLTELAQDFNGSKRAELDGGGCAFVRVQKKASGAAMQLLAQGWPDEETNGPRPVVWSPAGSAWGAILDQRLAEQGETAMAPPSQPFMRTPLVIAMPKPMAQAMGWPGTPIGYKELLDLAQDPDGWASKGHPEWGPFKLGKTNPNYSTSALNATIAQYYAATGKTEGLTQEDLGKPEVEAFARGVESAVVHYGDITMTFLNNWFRNDARGTALTYVSAVAVEEKSVIDYNNGNPDGILDPGEKPRKPRVPLVAIYPKEGTLFSDNPYIVLEADWVSKKERAGAKAFEEFIKLEANQRKALEGGFRPGNPDVEVGKPIATKYGVDPAQPQTTLAVPDPEVLAELLDLWAQNRKAARVLLVLDVSGSMGEPGDVETGETKLDLAKRAAITALDEFRDDDQVGLRIFSTSLGSGGERDYLDLAPIAPIGEQRESLRGMIADLFPIEGTPLYTVTGDSYAQLEEDYDPTRINAIVLLTDGRNEDPGNPDIDPLLRELRSSNEGTASRPVRIFPIAYGADADLPTLRRIAEATNAAVYDASDPTTIENVFVAVVSNF